MVIIKISGGLGNQMFQYALARSLIHEGRKVLLDCSGFDTRSFDDTKRDFELDRFHIKINKATPKEVSKYYNQWQLFLNYIGRLLKEDISKIVIEKEHCYHKEIAQCDDKYLIGFWQTEKYFKSIRHELLRDFSFQESALTSKNEKIRDAILLEEKSVGVHVRGGDYNTVGNVAIYGNICDTDYYNKAFTYIEKKLGKVKYYLFTNDTAWAHRLIPHENRQITIVDWNTEQDGWSDMYLMSICRHNIIANSSFSWWAAWLNQNAEKIVVAPCRWQNGIDIADIVPDEWVRIGQC